MIGTLILALTVAFAMYLAVRFDKADKQQQEHEEYIKQLQKAKAECDTIAKTLQKRNEDDRLRWYKQNDSLRKLIHRDTNEYRRD